MPDITLMIQVPERARNSVVSNHTVDVDGDEGAAELPDELGAVSYTHLTLPTTVIV